MFGIPFSALATAGAVVGSDAFKSMDEICKENGFASEEYTVQTSDDYILTLHRIPGMINETAPSD